MAGTLLLIKGHPGTGKSTLAKQLAAALGWPLVDKDDARDCMRCSLATPQELNDLSYAIMFRVAGTQLSLGMSCILDCPFARVSLYQHAAALAQQVGGGRSNAEDVRSCTLFCWSRIISGCSTAAEGTYLGPIHLQSATARTECTVHDTIRRPWFLQEGSLLAVC